MIIKGLSGIVWVCVESVAMTDTELYRQLLGLTAPWQVSRIELDLSQQEVRVYVTHDLAQSPLLCPECGLASPAYDLREERQWRHLDSCQFKTYLVAKLPRVACPTHGVKTVAASWCEPHSRFTLAFECFAIAVLTATAVQARAAGLLRLSPNQVQEVMARAVLRGLKKREADRPLPHLSLDEKSFKKGHQYISVLGDSLGKGVLEVVEGRTLEAATSLLTGLSPAQREQVASVSMDMWPAFASAREQVLPQAETVHDRFHIAGYLSDAVDKTRRDEHRTWAKSPETKSPQQSPSPLVKTKWLWLRSPEKLTEKQRALFAALQTQDLQTSKVWSFKEAFRDFFEAKNVSEGEAFFANWYAQAMALGNSHLTKVAEMLLSHLPGLLAYLRHRTTNAVAEGLNAQIQLIKARARGFRRFAQFRIAILFFLGKLDMNPHNSL
jgi:transposase